MTEFSVDIEQNPFLPAAAREVHAVLRVTAHGAAAAGGPTAPELAEVIVIDCSGSMATPRTKIIEARRATLAAIDALPEGVWFAIVQGTHEARMLFPREPGLVAATDQTRLRAKAAVAGAPAAGGTAIGSWLVHAAGLLATRPSAIGHALLLTDGKNEHENRHQLEDVLAACRGQFVCDARGIGDGWEPRELLRIAEVLQGTADAVRQPAELTADFRETMRAALAKTVPEARIRVTVVPWARVVFLKQAAPTMVDLAEHQVTLDERTVEYRTGSWGSESRDYHLCLAMDVAEPHLDEDIRVARIDVLVAGQLRAGPATAVAHWTDDQGPATDIGSSVSYYTEQAKINQLVVDGCDAYLDDDLSGALAHWTRAVERAVRTHNAAALEILRHLVEIDSDQRVVGLRADMTALAVKVAQVRSVQSASYPAFEPDRQPRFSARYRDAGPDRKCAVCDRVNPAGSRCCEKCGEKFDEAAGPDGPGGRAVGPDGPGGRAAT